MRKVPTRAQVHQGVTRRGFVVEITDEQTPELATSLEIIRSLSEFEAFIVSFVDGRMTVGELAAAAGLMAIETRSVVASLSERKVLRLRQPPPPPPMVPLHTPPMPPPVGLKERPLAAPLPQPGQLNHQAQLEGSLQAALTLERRGEIDGAISVLRTAISRAPNPAPIYNRLALVILNQRKDARQAEELLHKAIELDPENPVFKANLVKVLAYAAIHRR